MSVNVIQVDDVPLYLLNSESVAIDTETTGLNIIRDRLCLVQLCFGQDDCYLIKVTDRLCGDKFRNLKALLLNDSVQKIFHFARFDVSILRKFFDIEIKNIFCTKIASRLVRTYTWKHGLKDLCKELLSIDLSKEEQTSYWGAEIITESQLQYAAHDVYYLHKLRDILQQMLEREHRTRLAEKSFEALLDIIDLDLNNFNFEEIFNH